MSTSTTLVARVVAALAVAALTLTMADCQAVGQLANFQRNNGGDDYVGLWDCVDTVTNSSVTKMLLLPDGRFFFQDAKGNYEAPGLRYAGSDRQLEFRTEVQGRPPQVVFGTVTWLKADLFALNLGVPYKSLRQGRQYECHRLTKRLDATQRPPLNSTSVSSLRRARILWNSLRHLGRLMDVARALFQIAPVSCD